MASKMQRRFDEFFCFRIVTYLIIAISKPGKNILRLLFKKTQLINLHQQLLTRNKIFMGRGYLFWFSEKILIHKNSSTFFCELFYYMNTRNLFFNIIKPKEKKSSRTEPK